MEEQAERQIYPCPSLIFNPTTFLHHYLSTRRPNTSPINRLSSLFISTMTQDAPTPTPTDRTNDWAYSKPAFILDVVWNLAFVFVSVVVLFSTLKERPSTPLRIWVGGYAVQCLLHVGFVYFEHRRGQWGIGGNVEEDLLLGNSVSQRNDTSVAKRLETMNSMMSFFWWLVGFYWIVVGGQALLQDAPRLYWLTVVFLAFDVFFAIFCFVLACMLAIALCCCLPCIVAMLYSKVASDGASEDVIRVLPRYRFHQVSEPRMTDIDWKQKVTALDMENTGDSISKISLPPDDSECCICLSKYVDGVELHSLPCKHYFHSGCIVEWLRINAKCPLCKYNILDDELV